MKCSDLENREHIYGKYFDSTILCAVKWLNPEVLSRKDLTFTFSLHKLEGGFPQKQYVKPAQSLDIFLLYSSRYNTPRHTEPNHH